MATGTVLQTGPRVAAAQIQGLLEISDNCPYPGPSKWKGVLAPKAKGAESSAKTLRPLYLERGKTVSTLRKLYCSFVEDGMSGAS
jgi:hypothetical protein